LRGCLLAYSGEAFLLLDPGDPPADRRFTVAHELGH
jgi:Zn-dependent peptidase ImmA (M78 family)